MVGPARAMEDRAVEAEGRAKKVEDRAIEAEGRAKKVEDRAEKAEVRAAQIEVRAAQIEVDRVEDRTFAKSDRERSKNLAHLQRTVEVRVFGGSRCVSVLP